MGAGRAERRLSRLGQHPVRQGLTRMKILLLGCDGQVGWELQRSLQPLGDVLALDFQSRTYAADFSNPQALAATVAAVKPDPSSIRRRIRRSTRLNLSRR